ncbi:MAG: oligosaccharide flippase family protein [Phycisphaerales bacterium]|nr:oligosaccharide flippase family protein [Phycisphaerales bacterium]
MSKRRGQLLKGGAVLMVGEAVVQLCGLVRNFLVARLILPEQFGIAAALAMSVSLVEMLSDLGAGRFLTRAHDEDGESWLAIAHGISIIRGCVGGLLLVMLAGPIAALMKMPEATWAFRMVGLVPAMRGLTHNQIWLAQRELRFKAFVSTQAAPQILTLLAAYPLAKLLPDFRALLWLLMANAALAVVLSHVAARKPYRLAYDRERFRQLLAFGMPLLGDGILMFVVLHGERIVIANTYGKTLLGAYSAAFLLAWTPSAILGRVGLGLGVPQLASLRANREARDRQYAAGVRILAAPAIGMAVLFGLSGRDFVASIFTDKYDLSAALAAFLGLGQALRILRTFPTVIAVAESLTLAPMLGNLARASAVGVGWFVAQAGSPAWVVLAIGAGGELVALAVTAGLTRAKLKVPAISLVGPAALTLGAFALAWLASTSAAVEHLGVYLRSALGVLAGGTAACVTLCLDPSARHLIAGFLKHRRPATPMTGAPEAAVTHEAG